MHGWTPSAATPGALNSSGRARSGARARSEGCGSGLRAVSAAAGCVAAGAAQKTQPNGLRHNGGQYNIEHDRGTSVPISAQREQTVLFPCGKRGAIRRRGADSVPAGAAHVTAAQAGTAWQGPHELCGGGMAECLDDLVPLAVRRRSCRCARWSTQTLETLTLS